MAADLDDFNRADTGNFGGMGSGWVGPASIEFEIRNNRGYQFRDSIGSLIIRNDGSNTKGTDVENKIKWVNDASTGRYHWVVLRLPNAAQTSSGYTGYACGGNCGDEWFIDRIVSGSSTGAVASGVLGSSKANMTIEQIITIHAHETSGNPVFNMWVDGAKVVDDVEDTNASAIESGGRYGIGNWQIIEFDDWYLESYVHDGGGGGATPYHRATMAGGRMLTMGASRRKLMAAGTDPQTHPSLFLFS